MSIPCAHTAHQHQQLVLPFSGLPFPLSCLRPEPLPILPQHLWTRLSPTLQAQVRHTLLHISQEILYERTGSGQDQHSTP
jgi:hypothetical protein